jgi:hypothetical protein
VNLKRLGRRLLFALARAIDRWAQSIIQREMTRGLSSPSAEKRHSEVQDQPTQREEPPAVWAERVRRDAPGLLLPRTLDDPYLYRVPNFESAPVAEGSKNLGPPESRVDAVQSHKAKSAWDDFNPYRSDQNSSSFDSGPEIVDRGSSLETPKWPEPTSMWLENRFSFRSEARTVPKKHETGAFADHSANNRELKDEYQEPTHRSAKASPLGSDVQPLRTREAAQLFPVLAAKSHRIPQGWGDGKAKNPLERREWPADAAPPTGSRISSATQLPDHDRQVRRQPRLLSFNEYSRHEAHVSPNSANLTNEIPQCPQLRLAVYPEDSTIATEQWPSLPQQALSSGWEVVDLLREWERWRRIDLEQRGDI